MTDDRDALLREVDEELRREQLQKMWERYNGIIIGAAVLFVAAVAGYKFLEHRRIAAAEAAGAEFNSALVLANEAKPDEALKAFEKIAASGPRGYALLAQLHVAGAQAQAGKPEEAVKSFEALASETSADPLLKSFAQLQAASLRMGEADFTEMQNRLNSLAGDTSPFKISARELLGLSAFKAGKYDEARKQLEPLLIDPAAARPLQDRIKVVMAKIAEAEVATPAPASAAPTPAAPALPAETPAKSDAPPASGSSGQPAAAPPADDKK